MSLHFVTVLNLAFLYNMLDDVTQPLKCVSLVSLQSLGQVGEVLGIDGDGDVRIRVRGTMWTFSPAALTKNLGGTTRNTDDTGN